MFQYIIIHRILPTDGLLHKMNMIDYPTCPLKCDRYAKAVRFFTEH